jgi:UDP-N-acetylmuramate dehydrogenase
VVANAMHLIENASLKKRNTFGIAATARFFVQVNSKDALRCFLNSVTAKNVPLLVLGGGSNIVFAQDYQGVVLNPDFKGIKCVADDGERVIVEAAAGENWHEFVQYCLVRGWYGLENLSLIAGTVGAAPIQNIGAYGVELKDCFVSLSAMCIKTGSMREFSLAECAFGYRDSVFKNALKNQYVITAVRFCLSKIARVNVQYGDIAQELLTQGITQASPKQVAQAVITIRQRKLPNPTQIGNTGSFFKNPVVALAQFETLKAQYPHIVAYPQAQGMKLAAGWLIEQAGWKGQSLGQAGVYEKQALVLVNRGGVTGAEVVNLAQAIQKSVLDKFGVSLEIEVNVV